MSAGHLREFGVLADGRNYLAGINTCDPLYIDGLSRRNSDELERQEEQVAALSSQRSLKYSM